MKKRICIFALLLFACCLISTRMTKADEYNTEPPLQAPEPSAESWALVDAVDEFGDSVGSKYLQIYTPAIRESSSKVGEPAGIWFYYFPPENNNFESNPYGIRVMEDDTSKAIYDGSWHVLKIKDGDDIYEYDLYGTPPSGDMLIMFGGWEKYHRIWNQLLEGRDLRCIIYLDDMKYSFTVPAKGFAETCEPVNENAYQLAETKMEEEQYQSARMLFLRLGNYSDAAERAEECEEAFLESRYQEARALFEEEKYDEAKEIFLELGDYSDSAERAEECEELSEASETATAGDLVPSITIEYGDVAAIVALAKDAQNKKIEEGTVVAISGYYSKPVSSMNIMESDDSGKKGIVMIVDGDWEAPAEGTDIDIIGTFVNGQYNSELHVLPENITIK